VPYANLVYIYIYIYIFVLGPRGPRGRGC
jgi:hypothetical protein